MKKVSSFLFVVLVGTSLVLAGCKEDKPAEIVQTVDWYKEHVAERTELLQKCKDNPGELSTTPNCVNASRANSLITWGSKKGMNLLNKPLTSN